MSTAYAEPMAALLDPLDTQDLDAEALVCTLQAVPAPTIEVVEDEGSAPRIPTQRPSPLLRMLPPTDPPYDDERPEHERTWPRVAPSGWTQLALLERSELHQAVMAPMAFPVPQAPLDPEPAKGDVFDEEQAPEPSPDGLVPATRIAQRYVRAFLEVLSGQRQLRTLDKVASSEVLDELDNRGADLDVVWASTLRSIRICEPLPGIAEVSATVATPESVLALTMRLCGFDGIWIITHATFVR